MPSNLQMDKVSPATLLLEKRRQKYEVQKAFETEKAAFKAEEVKNKQREWDLREKDILIQENLLRFADTLQMQESMKVKDDALAQIERDKIAEKKIDIKKMQRRHKLLVAKQALIEKKLMKMQEFGDFMSLVQKTYKDDFAENNAALIRYQQQKKTNRDLNAAKNTTEKGIEHMRAKLEAYKQSKKVEIAMLGNEITNMKEELQEIDDRRKNLKAEGEDKALKKRTETKDHGQIIMTVNNMYKKLEDQTYGVVPKLIISSGAGGDKDEVGHREAVNFNDQTESEKLCIV